MAKHVGAVILMSAVMVTALAVAVARTQSAQTGLTVHEWGTFTSVAGADGQSVDWTPLSGPQDLPCFVEHARTSPDASLLTTLQVKGRDIYGLLKVLPGGPNAPAPVSQTFAAPALPSAPVVPPALMAAKVRMETPVLYFYSPQVTTV